MELVLKYFSDLNANQISHFEKLNEIIPVLNRKVNVISRQDVIHLEERHILHSLAIARLVQFKAGTCIIDVGTGGGFPGIPLAILFPSCRFLLVDSVGKKIGVVKEVIRKLGLQHVSARQIRVEQVDQKFDFVVSRAVTAFPKLVQWTRSLVKSGGENDLPNGILSLKGGDLGKELAPFQDHVEVHRISNWFDEPFFSTKMIVYLNKTLFLQSD